MKSGNNTPATVPNSPFFHPSTPHVVVVQQTPRGTRRSVQVKEEVHEHKSNLVGCTANLVNAIVGSGIVGIPFAIYQAGFVAGVILVLLCAVITEKSLRLLIATAKHVHTPTYETAAEAAFGRAGFLFVTINMFIMAYGAMLSYLMIVKDSFGVILGATEETDLPKKRAILIMVSLLIMVPLSSQRDMADLAKTSRLSVVIDTLLVAAIAYNSPVTESVEAIGGWRNMDIVHWDTIFVGLGVLSFAFVCQHSAFIIAGSLERPTIKRWSKATLAALTLCAILALTCGVTGYAGYMDNTQGNVLNNLDPDSWSANAARAMLGTTMLFVYPLESFVARHVCVVLLFSGRRAHEGDDASILNRRDRRIGLTFALYLLAVVPAAMFENMGSVLAVTGAIGGSCLSYLGPGLVYLGIHGGRFLELIEQSCFSSMLKPSSEESDISSAKKANQTSSHAVETTPLVSGKKPNPTEEAQDKGTENEKESYIMYGIKVVVWYASGFPLWCYIARWGKNGLTQHVHDLALKSPHPIRIGDVEYSKVLVGRGGAIEVDDPETASVLRLTPDRSFPLVVTRSPGAALIPPKSMTRSPGAPPSMNQQIGKDILKQRNGERARKEKEKMEADPQEEPPSWWDFAIAIFYILFGALAFVAGILSEAIEQE